MKVTAVKPSLRGALNNSEKMASLAPQRLGKKKTDLFLECFSLGYLIFDKKEILSKHLLSHAVKPPSK